MQKVLYFMTVITLDTKGLLNQKPHNLLISNKSCGFLF